MMGCAAQLGVDAGRAEVEELGDAGAVGGVDDVAGDGEVVVEEVGWVGVVGVDAADAGGGEDHHCGPVLVEEGVGGGLVEEVEFGVGAGEDVGEAFGLEASVDGAADEAGVAGEVEGGISVEARHGAQSLAMPRGVTSWPASRRVFSWRASSRSVLIMRSMSSSRPILGCQPSVFLALVASPWRASTSVGRW